jgi:hypothetical protein
MPEEKLALPPRKFNIGDIVRFEDDDDAENFTPCQIVGYMLLNQWYYFVANSFNVAAYNQGGYGEESLVKVTDLPTDMAWYLDGVLPYAEAEEAGEPLELLEQIEQRGWRGPDFNEVKDGG